MAERNFNNRSQQNQNGQRSSHQQQPSMQNNRQPPMQGNRPQFRQDNRPSPAQGNQQPFKQDNRQPSRQNYEQSGRQFNEQTRTGQNNQQSYMGRNEQQREIRNEHREQNESRNEQQRSGQYNQQRLDQNYHKPRVDRNGQQYGGRSEQQGGARNGQQLRVGGNGQQYSGRNEQQSGARNDQQSRFGGNGKQYESRNEQQGGARYDQKPRFNGNGQQNGDRSEQQRGRQNTQQRVSQNDHQPSVDRNRQQHGSRNEQRVGQNDQQPRVGGNGQQYGSRNELRRPGQNMQQQHMGQNDQQPHVDRNEHQSEGRNEHQGEERSEQPRGGRTTQQQRVIPNIQQPCVERNEQKPQMKANKQPLKQQGSHKDDESLQQQPHQGPSKENLVKNSVNLSGAKSKCLELGIPTRANFNKAGTKGRPILIEANHLPMILPPKMPIAMHYDVDIVPDKPKSLVNMAMEQFRKQYYPQRYPAYDGRKNLYSSSPLPIKDGVSCEISIMEDDRERTFKVTIKLVATIDLNVLQEYFQVMSNGRKLKLPEEAIHCLEVVLRSAASNGCTSVGQSFFTRPRTMMDLGEGMEMYSGIYQSAILGWRPFLNVDVAHKPFPKCLKITDLITEFCKNGIVPEDMKKADKFLRTLKVRYEIPGDKNSKRISRVNQLDKNAITARFTNENGIEMTVADYYEKVKKYKLRYPDLPCLWVGNKQKRILYPAELCTLVENQVTNRTMTPNQTSKMIKYAATSSTVRKNKIMASVKAANYNNDKTVSEFGIKVSDEFITIEARVLEPPKLQYSRKGVWRSDKFKNAKSLNNWAILCVDGRVREAQLQSLAESVIKQGRFVGMNIERPSSAKTVRLSNQRAQDELKREFQNLKDVDLILVVIPEDKSTYANVKRASELQVGVLTQCIRSKNIFNLKDTTIANVLLKVNAKLNGVNHSLFNTPLCLKRPCIIMGADVTHPSPESNGMVPSVAAVTASHDPKAFQYNISWRLQPPTQEIITDLANIVKQHLIFFYRKNNVKPERIIFFRDGVSEGQFQHVLQEEVMAIRKACLMLEKEGTYKPAITFIVVQKRHHTRLFPKNPRDSEDKNLNVPAGTVVDTTITHPTDLDFYLVSHASIQGVARPTKYRKLWDDFGMQEDELEELTYHLCHMFSRCNRSVSYPAPTYYAHLAATRAKIYCEGINLSMNDNLEAMQKKLEAKKEIISDLPMYFV